tara:strand:- start:683 stop:859 length:177 start_codon:yes stop_codon:yes gene_type:complete
MLSNSYLHHFNFPHPSLQIFHPQNPQRGEALGLGVVGFDWGVCGGGFLAGFGWVLKIG